MAPPPTSVETPGTPPAGAAEKGSPTAIELALKVLGAIGAGIGVLGFVTLFGGAILWVRAKEAGLPANEIVAVVPSGVLVTTGASFLVPAVLIALLAVILILGVHMVLSLSTQISVRDRTAHANLLRYEANQASYLVDPLVQAADSSRKAAKASVARAKASQKKKPRKHRELLEEASELVHLARRDKEKADEQRTAAANLELSAGAEEAELEKRRLSSPARDKAQHWVEYAIVFLVLTLLPLLVYGSLKDVTGLQKVVLVAVAFAAAGLSLATFLSTGRNLVWLGVVAFMAVGLYTGLATYFRTVQNPKVEPAAALLGNRPPAPGVFLAETSSNLYLGTFTEGNVLPRVLVIPVVQVTDLSIGPLLDPKAARLEAIELAQRECHRRLEKAGVKKSAAAPLCTKHQVSALRALASRS